MIVLYKGTLVNIGKFSYVLILLKNPYLFLILYSDDGNVDRRVAKYFAVLYVALPAFDMIGLKGKFSTFPFFFLNF